MKFENRKLSERFGAVLRGELCSVSIIKEALVYAETTEVIMALRSLMYSECIPSEIRLLEKLERDLNDKGL